MPGRSSSPSLLDAAVAYGNAGIPLLPYQAPTKPERPSDAPCATCRRLDCPAPPVHPTSRLDPDASTQQASRLHRWWTTEPHAPLATLTGTAFDLVEIHTTIPPEIVLAPLHDRPAIAGPVLHAGRGRLQLLARPGSYEPDRYDSAIAAILYLSPGSLILLPPSRLPGGQPVTWFRPLGDLDQLPDGGDLFWALTDLAAGRQLADPSTYAFHGSRHHPDDASVR